MDKLSQLLGYAKKGLSDILGIKKPSLESLLGVSQNRQISPKTPPNLNENIK